MEFGERKRRRKSQSFKLVTDEDSPCTTSSSSSCKEVNRASNNSAAPDVWVGEEGMEIKRQITGMMRLLSDRSGRVYQRVTAEQDAAAEDPRGRPPSWPQQQQPAAQPADRQRNSWSPAADPGPSPSSAPADPPGRPGCGRRGLGPKASGVNDTKDLNKAHEANADSAPPAEPEAPCCMCNCKGTLRAILREMRAMRRLMMAQKACKEKQAALPARAAGLGAGQTGHCGPRRRRPVYKAAPQHLPPGRRAPPAAPEAPAPRAVPADPGQKEGCEEQGSPPVAAAGDPGSSGTSAPPPPPPPQHQPVNINHTPASHLNQNQLEPEVRLAEDYDIFISKAQLDSILVNYTRSGSLLFRKLVCAFFDDATLANSLPNGKRKRGLNDNRKGLDQNIVGAIKEKYCTEHRIEKLPGPRDWVQILQDQIKLARRRLKRDAAEVEDGLNGPSTSCTKPGAAKESVPNTMG